MASRTPTKQHHAANSRQQQQRSPCCPRRHSVSHPPVVQGAAAGDLVKQLVSASGQGCAAVVPAGHPADGTQARGNVWRTRSVRSRAESYCILSLKGASQRGVTIQVRRQAHASLYLASAMPVSSAWMAGQD